MTMTARLLSRDLMTHDPLTVHPADGMARAERTMRDSRVRHLPVVDTAGVLVGLLSERDVLALSHPLGGTVEQHMRSELQYVSPDSPAHEAAYLILRHRIGCVPVVDDRGVLVGLISDSDLVRVAYVMTGGLVPVDELEAEEREAEHV